MRIPGSIYYGKDNRRYLATYVYYPDIYRAAPPSASDSERIAHVSYAMDRGKRGIDIFLLGDNFNFSEVGVKREIYFSGDEYLSDVDARHNIEYEIIARIRASEIEEELLYFIRRDVRDFCRKEPKRKTGSRFKYLEEIRPRPEERRIPLKRLLESGKQDFVPSCGLEANLDFSWGCVSGFVNGFSDPFAECKYCYSGFQHKNFWKYMIEVEEKQLKEELFGECYLNNNDEKLGRAVKVLRLGKRTEVGSKFTLDSLVLTLETCLETGTRIVLPTKYLEFDREIAKLLRRTYSSLLYSSTNKDELERGACSSGYDNAFRLEQATLYREVGVNSVIYLHINLPYPPTNEDKNVLGFSRQFGIPVQLLPFRIYSKETALLLTGKTWDTLKGPLREPKYRTIFFKDLKGGRGGYLYKKNQLVAQEKDPFWLGFVGDNKGSVRMCHHDDKETYCGRCFLDDKGFIIPTEHVKIDYSKRNGENWRRKDKRKWAGNLFYENDNTNK